MQNTPQHLFKIVGFTLLCSSMSLYAETLDEAWNRAIENNHQIKASKADTSSSEQRLEAAEAQRLPDLSVKGGYTQYSETPAAKAQFSGMPAFANISQAGSAQFNTSQAGSGQAQAIASVPIFTSGRISHNISAAEASLEAAQANEITSALSIKMQVAEAYVAVLRAESSLQLAQSHVDSLTSHHRDVKNMLDQGVVARNDLLAANVELVNAQQLVVQMANQLDIAKAKYNQLLDRNLNDTVTLERKFPVIPKGDLNELTGNAIKQRSELVTLSQQIEALDHQSQSVKAGLLPQFAVKGGYQYQENRYQAFEGMWMANVGMEWKLDASSHHQSDAISRQAASLKEQRDDLTSQINLQVRQAWLDIQETQKRTTVTQQVIEQADENMKVTKERYQQGLSTNTDVLKAEDLRTSAHDNFNDATYDLALATLHLRRALGML